MKKLGKQQKVQEQIFRYNNQVVSCLDVFKQAFANICNSAETHKLQEGYVAISAAEEAADAMRRGLENMMYTQAVFPESRGDILGLVEAIDRIANCTESAVRMVLNQHIEVPKEYCPLILELVDVTSRCVSSLLRAVDQLFDSFLDAAATIGEVNRLESETDMIAERLIDKIFSSDQSDLQKILLRDLTIRLSTIADRAETAGERIRIMVAKRSL